MNQPANDTMATTGPTGAAPRPRSSQPRNSRPRNSRAHRILGGLLCLLMVLVSAVLFRVTEPNDAWGDHAKLRPGVAVPFDDDGATMTLTGHRWASTSSNGGNDLAHTPGLFLMVEVVITADRTQVLSPEVTLTAGGDTFTPTRMNSAIVPPGFRGTVQVLFDLPPAVLNDQLSLDFRPSWNVWLYAKRPQLTLRLTDAERAAARDTVVESDQSLQPEPVP